MVLFGDVERHRSDNAGDITDRSRGTAGVSRRTSSLEAGVSASDQVCKCPPGSQPLWPAFNMVLFEEQRERHAPRPDPVGAARGGLHAMVCPSATAARRPQVGDWESIRERRVRLPALLLKTPLNVSDASNGSVAGPVIVLPQSQIRDYFYCHLFFIVLGFSSCHTITELH